MRLLPIMAALGAAYLHAQPGGRSLIAGDPAAAFAYQGPASGAVSGRVERVAVQDMPFTSAYRMITASLPPQRRAADEWALRLTTRGAAGVERGTVVLASLWLRCISSEMEDFGCATRFIVERNGAPWTKSAQHALTAGPAWREEKFLFRMAEPYAPGEYTIHFRMGMLVQQMEVGGIRVEDFGPGATADSLGVSTVYPGGEEGAAWRYAAFDRIERIRKGDLTVKVTGTAGQPLPGAEVRVRMKRHAFGWGTAVAAGMLLGTDRNLNPDDVARYRQAILDNFNMVVFENDLKWPEWERNPQRALDGIAWMRERGIHRIRGHNLIWPSWRHMPASAESLRNHPEALRARINGHFASILSATAGLIAEWDVVNEPYTNHDAMDVLGWDEMAEWFKLARRHDPETALYINDYGILSAGGVDFAHQNHYFRTIQRLDELEAGVQGIGMQGHFASPTPPERMLAILDRFAKLGKAIAITEYDLDTLDEPLQAKFTEDLMIVCFSHPAVRQFLMWGFWEGRHWKPPGAMIRRDWTSKPMHDVWRSLIYRYWWTNESGQTGEDGRFEARGFLGDYEVEACAGARCAAVPAVLVPEGAGVSITLPVE
jgi:GH35 family endo-1,4-beta-xylanase